MKTRKDMDKVLKQEAKLAAHSQCYAWARLFLQCAYLLRKKDRENERLTAALLKNQRPEAEKLAGVIAWIKEDPDRLAEARVALKEPAHED